jgi:alkanesulfonate monooxygenase SsuD/methylene tetrahydromethanopterin reductase-like flavin-dependent oxidoreductase (luciferase family)/predicted kinase
VRAAGPEIPDPALVVLAGASGSGKSHWAAGHYRATEVVSSDALRAVAGSGPYDLDASVDAFELLDKIVAARVGRGLTAVVDTLGLNVERRREQLALARRHGVPAVVVVLTTDPATCRRRNAARDVPVPAGALAGQLRRMRELPVEIADEGWDLVIEVDAAGDIPEQAVMLRETAGTRPGPVPDLFARNDGELTFVLQISSFPWDTDPLGWLTGVVAAAHEAGFAGVALMDHLIQIPQVGRAWDPIPEPWVTLGMIAARQPDLLVGTLVSPVTFRSPGLLAKTVATLDALSGGRAFCGLGIGWWEREHRAFGLDLPPAADRYRLLETTIETMKALWAKGTKPHIGRRADLPETTCYPRPVSDVPIVIGGGGERRTLRIAAELADACNLRSDPDSLPRKISALREHCASVGRPPEEVAVTVLDLPIVGSDRDDVARRVERLRGRTAAATFAARHGAGTPDRQIERYRALAAMGVHTVFVSPQGLSGPDDLSMFARIAAALR